MWPVVASDGRTWSFDEPGYRDAVCALISDDLIEVIDSPEKGLVLSLTKSSVTSSSESSLVIDPGPSDLTGPEIAMLRLDDGGGTSGAQARARSPGLDDEMHPLGGNVADWDTRCRPRQEHEMAATKLIWVDADLFEAASAEGAVQSRSTAQQINHWARMGRNIAVNGSAGKKRIAQVLAGTEPLHQLGEGEQLAVNAELDADINARAAAAQFGPTLSGAGVATVALDGHGVLTRYHPDGTTSPLE